MIVLFFSRIKRETIEKAGTKPDGVLQVVGREREHEKIEWRVKEVGNGDKWGQIV